LRLLEQKEADWSTIAPYLDTLLLPVYSYQMKDKLLDLEEVSKIEYITEELEKSLVGRILLLPAYNAIGDNNPHLVNMIADLNKQLVHSGFHYTFLVILEKDDIPSDLDTSIHVLSVKKDADIDAELERLYEEVLTIWQSV
jgi:hypothetical protein